MIATPKRTIGALGAVALALAIIAMPGTADSQEPGQGPAERVGEQFDRVLRGLEQNFRNLSSEVRQKFAEARQRIDNLGVEARVYSRLHWDQALNQAQLAVEVQLGNSGAVVILYGTVADEDSRAKAVRLTVETVGVDRVVDKLRVVDPRLQPQNAEPTPRSPGQ